MRKQRGVTMIGWIFLLFPVVVVFYALLRIGPVYYGHYKLVQAMKSTATKLRGDETLTPHTVRTALDSQFNTGYVDVLDPKDIDVAKNAEGGWSMTADYERDIEYLGNLHLLLVFNEVVVID